MLNVCVNHRRVQAYGVPTLPPPLLSYLPTPDNHNAPCKISNSVQASTTQLNRWRELMRLVISLICNSHVPFFNISRLQGCVRISNGIEFIWFIATQFHVMYWNKKCSKNSFIKLITVFLEIWYVKVFSCFLNSNR